MTITDAIREQVQRWAEYACEFCGVSETDTGSQLTIDHFKPQSKGGTDNLDNLLYCCPRCNQYKLDYWPTTADDPQLWNPRRESATQHFVALEDGKLFPLTSTGAFTLERLRLNRPPLTAHRLQKQRMAEENKLLVRYRDLIGVLEQLLKQQAALLEEQESLLEKQQRLLQIILGNR